MRNNLRHKKQQEHCCTFRLSKKMRSPLGPLCEGAPPAGGGGENCAVARNISGYGKVLSLAEGGFSTLLYIAMFLLFLLGQYRIILSADTASEARQLLSQKRR